MDVAGYVGNSIENIRNTAGSFENHFFTLSSVTRKNFESNLTCRRAIYRKLCKTNGKDRESRSRDVHEETEQCWNGCF